MGVLGRAPPPDDTTADLGGEGPAVASVSSRLPCEPKPRPQQGETRIWTAVAQTSSGQVIGKVMSLSSVGLLCDPMDCSLPDFFHGIFQARVLEWVAISFSRVTVDFEMRSTWTKVGPCL